MCFVTNDLPKEIYCLLPRRHIIHLEVQGKFSFIPFLPLKRIWASSADRWLPFALPEIWHFKEGGCWPAALDGSVDHPFCSASCRERGCCQHWGGCECSPRETEIMRAAKSVSIWCLAWLCILCLGRFESRQRGFGYLLFAPSSNTLGSWQNQFGSLAPCCRSFREWAGKIQSEPDRGAALPGAPLKLPNSLLKFTPSGCHCKLSVLTQCWCNCRRVFFQESLQWRRIQDRAILKSFLGLFPHSWSGAQPRQGANRGRTA